MSSKKKMSLKSAIQLFEQLETVPATKADVVEAVNVIVNSNDIAHMSRKGLHNAIWFLVETIERCRIASERGQ